MKRQFIYLLLILLGFSACQDAGSDQKEVFHIDTIKTPDGLTAEVAALDFLPDGRLVAAFMRGEIMIYNPKTAAWSLFATGLHEPLGLKVINEKEMLVMQLPELTRIRDTDGDGQADDFETVYDGFGMTGNYHEFTYGPVSDGEGNLFIALNSSSSGGGVSPELRGDTLGIGRAKEGKPMFSIVPYRGWVMKISKDGQVSPFASGFRSPNGLGIDAKGRLFVSENQGDWVGSSPLFHVQQGKFYGHPAGLVWTPGWNQGNPFDLGAEKLDSMREKPAIIFPHDLLANSPTQPVLIKDHPQLKAYEGQFIIGEMNKERLVRVALEDIKGNMQGMATIFIENQGLRKGNNRLAFAPNGDLWVGQSDHGWLGDRGVQRISFTGKVPFDVQDMNLKQEGFDLNFTNAIADFGEVPLDSIVQIRRYRYLYHQKYGSPQVDVEAIKIKKADVKNSNKKLSLQLEKMDVGFVYEFQLNQVFNKKRTDSLENRLYMYTLKEKL